VFHNALLGSLKYPCGNVSGIPVVTVLQPPSFDLKSLIPQFLKLPALQIQNHTSFPQKGYFWVKYGNSMPFVVQKIDTRLSTGNLTDSGGGASLDLI